jgi:hypothetical protein
MKDTYVDWSKINLIKLELSDTIAHNKLSFIKLIQLDENKLTDLTIKTKFVKHFNGLIEMKADIDGVKNSGVTDYISEEVFTRSLIDSINQKRELLHCNEIVEKITTMRNNVMLSLWDNGTIAFLPDTKYQLFNGNGTIMSDGKIYGSFQGIEFLIPHEEPSTSFFRSLGENSNNDRTMIFRLSYAYAPKFPERVNIRYALNDSNIVIALNDVELGNVDSDDGFKTFDTTTNSSSFSITKINEDQKIIYPGELQELKEIPKITHNDKRIARRLNSVISLDTSGVSEVNIKTDTVRSRFRKLV